MLLHFHACVVISRTSAFIRSPQLATAVSEIYRLSTVSCGTSVMLQLDDKQFSIPSFLYDTSMPTVCIAHECMAIANSMCAHAPIHVCVHELNGTGSVTHGLLHIHPWRTIMLSSAPILIPRSLSRWGSLWSYIPRGTIMSNPAGQRVQPAFTGL